MRGHTISHYRIVAELGRGGMGVVYKAHDERLRRSVALKLLPEKPTGQAGSRDSLLAEARAASALNHPAIATIYEVGEQGGQDFIVMELVEGNNLRTELVGGPLEIRRLLRIGAQIAEALAAAHDHGVVHGDVKPENVVVLPDGRIKLLDFGVARRLDYSTLTTLTSALEVAPSGPQLAGTLAYMAPELFRGEAASARSDLFSLGIVLFELATRNRPFPGPTAADLMTQILNEPPLLLRSLAPHAPEALERVVCRLLERQPSSRYQSASDVRAELTRLARDLEVGLVRPAVEGKRAVAVLPFKLLTPNPEDDYLSVALADALINQLSGNRDLLVRPTHSVLRYARQSVEPRDAACDLAAEVVVEGSVQKLGHRLRVHLQAWNAAEGSALFSAKYESDQADLFGLQDRMSAGLSQALGRPAAGTAAAISAPPTDDPAAYELFLRARARLSHVNRWDTHTAIEILESALRLDQQFAGAWGLLAEACIRMGSHFDAAPRWFQRGERAIRRTLALDPGNPEAHAARGQLLFSAAKGFCCREALRALNTALRYGTSTVEARRFRCNIFYHVGLHQEAKEGLLEILAASPDHAPTLDSLAHTALSAREYGEAEEYYARVFTIDSTNLWAHLISPLVPLQLNRLDRAEQRIQAAYQVAPGEATVASCEALLWAKRGERRKAQQILQRALRSSKIFLHTHHMLHNAAATYALLGKPEPAVRLLRKASATGLPNYPLFRDDPHLRALQDEPKYLRLLADLKKQWLAFQREFGRAA